ncbi:MAG: hypothetical protein AAFX79_01875 [Planctomycetota bacterium]
MRGCVPIRRGFALPLVVLLAMVATIAMAVMMQRQGQQNLTLVRQVQWTKDRHLERGLREVIGAWLPSAGRRLGEISSQGGHALDIQFDDGRSVRVEVFDAQGSALANFDGIRESQLDEAVTVLEAVEEAAGGGDTFERWTRDIGPLQISARTAPEPLIAAAASAALSPGRAADLARDLVLAREEPDAAGGSHWMRRLISDYSETGQERTLLTAVFTAEADLWSLRITVYDQDGDPRDRYEALVEVDGREIRRRTDSGQFAPLGPFQRWRRVPSIEDGRVPR